MLMNYKAISKGLNDRELVKESEVTARLTQLLDKNPNLDYYVSVFKYNEKHLNQFKINKSLSGINDNVASSIIFDFDDSSGTLKIAQSDAATLVDRLVADGVDTKDVKIYFSGAKGMHVEVNTDKDFTREELINIRTKYTEGLNTSDNVIKDNQRIIRAVFSKHNKSGLYKIPLTYEELKTATPEEIKFWAKDPDNERYILENSRSGVITPSENMLSAAKPIKQKEPSTVEAIDKPDFSKNKTGLTNAKYALSQGFFGAGERHEAVMILAATYMGLGWHQELAYNNIKATLRLRADREGMSKMTHADKKEIWQEVGSVYSPLWLGGMYSDDTNPLLLKIKQKYDISSKFETNTIININELKIATEDFLKNLKDNRIYTGLESLDKNLILTKGMLFGVLGCPGSGKTSFLNVFVENTSKNHGPVLYFSMDMSKDLLGTKIIQRYTGYSLEKLEDMILHGTYDAKYKEAIDKFSEDYKNVGFCFENGYTVEKVSEEIKRYEDKIGQRVSMVAVDYLEKVQGPFSEETANSGYVASNLANLAKKHDTCIGLLLQPNKLAGLPSDELKSYRSIKGASKIEQDARAIIGLWRPGYDPENYMQDRYMSIAILKQNMGKLGRFDYIWNGQQGSICDMGDEQRRLFKSFLQELEQRKKEKEDGGL